MISDFDMLGVGVGVGWKVEAWDKLGIFEQKNHLFCKKKNHEFF